jgi:cytochrome c2
MARSQTLHEYNIPRLNGWFAALSVLMVVCVIGMVVDDYNRDWKRYQRDYYRLERERLQKAEAQELEKIGPQQLDAARQAVTQAQAELQGHQDRLAAAQARLHQTSGDWYVRDQSSRFLKAAYDVVKYEFGAAQERHDADAAMKLRSKIEGMEDELSRRRLASEAAAARRDSVSAQLADITRQHDDAAAKLDELTKSVRTMEKRLLKIAPTFSNRLLNFAMLDFIAPSIRIQQVLPPNLTYTVNFGVTARIDRCQTCHLAIDKAGWEDAPQPFRTHPKLDLFVGSNSKHSLADFGCTECHGGRPNGLDFNRTAHTPNDEEEAARWRKQYGWKPMHYWEWPMFAAHNYESGCLKCHQGTRHIGGAPQYDRGRDLVERSGCYGCHKIAGYEGLPKIGPSLLQVARKLTPAFAYRWINDPKLVRAHSKMPRVFNLENVVGEYRGDADYWSKRSAAEVNGIVAYLFDKSARGAYAMPAGQRGNAARGKELFESIGCRACHMIGPEQDAKQDWAVTPRERGPNLEAVATKTSPEWIFNWIRDPRQYDSKTAMPNLRLTEQEALDVTAYLTTLRGSDDTPYRRSAPDSAMVEAVIMDYLTNTQPVAVAREQLTKLAAHQRAVLLGEKIIARQGCFGCHEIAGFEKTLPIGTELTEEGSKPVARLAFNNVRLEPSLEAWLTHKMLHPRNFDEGMHMLPGEKARMPEFGFSEPQAQAIVGNILAWSKNTVPLDRTKRVDSRGELIAKGERLIAFRNCRGCHVIEGEGGAIYDVIPEPAMRPPNLANEGAKVQPDWLVEFLHGPFPIRPWVQVRMPTFGFTPEEAGTAANYFMALAKKNDDPYPLPALQSFPHAKDGAQFFAIYKCQQCHPAKVTAASAADRSQLAPNLAMASKRLRPDWVVAWLTDPQTQMPGTNMPTFFYADGEYFFPEAPQHIEALRDYLMTFSSQVASSSSQRGSAKGK